MKYFACLLLLLSFAASAEEVADCSEIANAVDRLSCFDQNFPRKDSAPPVPENQTEVNPTSAEASTGEPASIPQTMIDYLQRRVTQWNNQTCSHQLNSGEKVVVTGGPFDGLEGIFQRYIPGRQRCRILLQIVGRLTSVELPAWELKGASTTKIDC